MKEKMPWLKTRLRDVGKTPAALARALGIAPPRVYEMIAGRRHIQPKEIDQMAAFLEWTREELIGKLPVATQKLFATLSPKATDYLHSVASVGVQNGTFHALLLELVSHAPKPVEATEIKNEILATISRRWAGRPISWSTIEMALALACFEVKAASLQDPSGEKQALSTH